MTRLIAALTTALLLAPASSASAQWPWYYPPGRYVTTPYESAAQGLAEIIRARGQAYQAYTRGLINYEQARSQYIENRRKWRQAYWERRRAVEARRVREYQEAQKTRLKALAQQESGYPPRLGPNEVDPVTGKIYWPEPLKQPEYASLRRKLQELMLLRAQTGSSGQYADEIYEKARAMQAKLKEHIDELRAPEYIAAHNFLESLAYAGRRVSA